MSARNYRLGLKGSKDSIGREIAGVRVSGDDHVETRVHSYTSRRLAAATPQIGRIK